MLLQDIETVLTAEAPFTAGSETFAIRTGYLPDTPDAVIGLEEYPGGKPIRAMGPSRGAPLKQKFILNVIVRSAQKAYTHARTIAESVNNILDGLHEDINGRRYYVEAINLPSREQQDRNSRWLIETQYMVVKDRG